MASAACILKQLDKAEEEADFRGRQELASHFSASV
jgi:hypothetical protein